MRTAARIAITAALAALPVSMGAGQQPPSGSDPHYKVRLDFNRWHDVAELKSDFETLQKAWPKFLKVSSLGTSHDGRDIILMTVNNPDTGPESGKAGMYIEANVHGNEIQGGEVALYTIWYLMENYGRIDRITRLVDERVFYIIPTVNPDGRDHFLQGTGAGARTGHVPVDDDNDGTADEDGDDDLNGNGVIEQIRKYVPGQGTLRKNAQDPRILEPVPAGQTGDYVLLGSEGIDNDGDGRVNEDPVGGYDGNRNWASNWQPNYIQGGAMDYPFQLPEAKAVNDFLKAHPNIAGVQSYHNSGGMILRGPGAEWQGEYPRSDVTAYDELGRQGERMLPYYRYLVIWSGLYTVHGGFIDWTNDGLGILSFSNELWNGGQDFNSPALQEQQRDPDSPINDRVSQVLLRRLPRVRRPVRRLEGIRPSPVRQGRAGRLEEDPRTGAAALHERGAVPSQHGVFALPGRRDAAGEKRRDDGGGDRRRRLPRPRGFHEREDRADDPRQGSGEQHRPARPVDGRGEGDRGAVSGVGAEQVPPRSDRADRSARSEADPDSDRASRPRDAHGRVPRARNRRDDRDLRLRERRSGGREGLREAARSVIPRVAPRRRGSRRRGRREPGDRRGVGIPGASRGGSVSRGRYGVLARERVLAPATRLAERGFPVGPILADFIAAPDARQRVSGLHRPG